MCDCAEPRHLPTFPQFGTGLIVLICGAACFQLMSCNVCTYPLTADPARNNKTALCTYRVLAMPTSTTGLHPLQAQHHQLCST